LTNKNNLANNIGGGKIEANLEKGEELFEAVSNAYTLFFSTLTPFLIRPSANE